MFRFFASFASIALLLIMFRLPVASQQEEQYTALVLPAPAAAPGGDTRALALNNSGQVFGIAGIVNVAPPSYVPVEWTSGVPSILPPLPPGSEYHFNAFTGPGYDFINDSGMVVSLAINDAIVVDHPNDGRRPIIWQNGTPTILPLPDNPICTTYAAQNGIVDLNRLNMWPLGLNEQGEVLLYTCGAFWIWNSGTTQLLVQQSGVILRPSVAPSGNHLNNLHQALLENFVPGAPIGSQPLFVPAIYSLAGNIMLPITPLPNLAGHTINNNGQVLAFYFEPNSSDHLELWDGAQVVDLGQGGAASLNDRGQIVFSTPFPSSSRIYKNGSVSSLSIPAPLAGRFLLNNVGQIAVNTSFTNSQPYAVLFTPMGHPTPTLGNYPDLSVQLSSNTTVFPDTVPANTTSVNVSTSTDFKGKLEADPNTGSVRVTDAHPAGTYMITTKAFNGSAGPTATKTFTITVTTPPTCNPTDFAATTFEVGDRVGEVVVGDFNGDGNQDLAIGAINGVLLGDGAGGFNAVPGSATFPSGPFVVGDFNGDGKQDLAVLNSSNVSTLLGDGTGQFSVSNTSDTGCANPFALAVGDFNGDGKLDLATACYFTDTVTILFGNGLGGFGTPASFSVSDGPQGLAVGDFNGDGRQDLAIACYAAGKVSILLGDGAGSFASAPDIQAGATTRDIEVGDFNGDGKQDLAVSNPSTNSISVLLGDGAGAFGSATGFGVGINPTTVIAVGDFNGDGRQDLAVPNFGSANVSILLGDGVGGFGPAVNFGVGLSPFGVAVGDFNGDGLQDLATPNWDSNNVSILLRDCARTQPCATVITTIPSTAGPWNPSLNPSFDYGVHDNTQPVVIDTSTGMTFTPGNTITVTYLNGTVQAGAGYAPNDADGEPGNVTNSCIGTCFPAFYMNPGPDVLSMELVGTFANNGVIVGRPFPIGNGPTTLTVPTGANQLLLGINDNRYGDNSGFFTIAISSGSLRLTPPVLNCPSKHHRRQSSRPVFS